LPDSLLAGQEHGRTIPLADIGDPNLPRQSSGFEKMKVKNCLEISQLQIECIDENGGGPGVRLRKWHQKKG